MKKTKLSQPDALASRCIDMTHGWSQQMLRTIFRTLLILLALSAEPARAQEFADFYTGVRQLGMGGAYTAVVNDETAILTNPAGLGKVRDYTFTIIDPEIHGSFENTKVAKLDNFTKVFSVQGLLDALNQSKGTHWHAKVQVFPSFIVSNFGIGLHAKYSYDAEVSEDGTIYRLDYVNDYAAALAYNFRFFGGILKLGVAGRLVNRVEVHEDLDATATSLELDTIAREGMGFGSDIGVILTAPVVLLPSISAVVRDVGGTSYTLSDGLFHSTEFRPERTSQRIDAGVAIFPILANHVRATLTAEVHDVTTLSEEENKMKRFHAGGELNVADFFFLRAGANQGYWTAGIELASESFQLQAASYGEELGVGANKKEDRRWVGKFTLRF